MTDAFADIPRKVESAMMATIVGPANWWLIELMLDLSSFFFLLQYFAIVTNNQWMNDRCDTCFALLFSTSVSPESFAQLKESQRFLKAAALYFSVLLESLR